MDEKEQRALAHELRNIYYFIRVFPAGQRNEALRRKHYRRAQPIKKRLLEAGVTQNEIRQFLTCCRKGACQFWACLDCPNSLF